jgi:hypothetical protein
MTPQDPKDGTDKKSGEPPVPQARADTPDPNIPVVNAGGSKPPSKFESLLDEIYMGGRVEQLEQQVAKHEQDKKKHEQERKTFEKKQKALEEEIVQLKKDKQDMARALKTANGKINNQELLIKSLRKEIDRLEDQQHDYMQGLIEPLTPIHHTDDPVPQSNTSAQKPNGSDPVNKKEAVPEQAGITIDPRFAVPNDPCRRCLEEGKFANHALANCPFLTHQKRRSHKRSLDKRVQAQEDLEQRILAEIGREMEEGPGALEMERILAGGKNVGDGAKTEEASGEPSAKRPRTT